MFLSKFLPLKIRAKKEYKKKLKKSGAVSDLKDNERLKNSFSGKRCFIIGNGPSIKKEDLSLLKNQTVFTVNDMYLYEQFSQLNTDYHLLFDPAYINQFDTIVNKINSFSENPPVLLTSLDYKNTIRDKEIKNQIIYLKSGFDVDHLKYVGLNIDGLLPYYCTVIQYAISFAIECGFSQIYLLGCDCTGIENFIDRKKGELPKSYCFDMKDEDEKLIAPTMIGSEHAFYEWYHVFKSYRLLNDVAKERKIEIIDLTADGILDVFPKLRLNNVLGVCD